MNEIVFRFLSIWAHARWMRCGHFEKRHQAVKRYWRNTNAVNKSRQVLLNLIRKSALIHVLSGGFWCQQQGDQIALVTMGPLAKKHVEAKRSVAHQVLRELAPGSAPTAVPVPIDFDSKREEQVYTYHAFYINVSFVEYMSFCSFNFDVLTLILCFAIVKVNGKWYFKKQTKKELNEADMKLIKPLIDVDLKTNQALTHDGKVYYVKTILDRR